MSIDVNALRVALELMVFGMGGVFLVLFLLYLVSIILLKIFPGKKETN
ncbi:OadG-related small transporter subunit [Vagococcus acidifermentans]|uniref:Oxaloacetate decarboxylase, gamma chain family protein n=1 Tax=Vagococcus acidifermentans TaxID=564710 RepID=A0A430B0T3_9ENTE|nr:OadG-related small transporter subunit [Vagococcus acidifermentans]RSU13957.1 oxaloacetate decarboxylase, gamma chain family protein [Vagococcus acidifermentans]